MIGMSRVVEFGVQWKNDPPTPMSTREAAVEYQTHLIHDATSHGLTDFATHYRVVSRTIWHHESPWTATT